MKGKSKRKGQGWFCRECGQESAVYLGKCPGCGAWSSLAPAPETKAGLAPGSGDGASAQALRDISVQDAGKRLATGLGELDRVLGGGLQPGSLVLLGGDPGIGKSTLLLQVLGGDLAADSLYVSGEESAPQVKGRAKRLGVDEQLRFLAATDLELIASEIETHRPSLVVIDSVQSVQLSDVDSLPGSVAQIRACSNLLMNLAKQSGVTIVLVGHITKEGAIAGPKLLEHLVDVVLYFEGERSGSLRMLRGFKNRFGPTDEVGIFDMRESGLHPVDDPSGIFLSQGERPAGTVVTAALQGTRVLIAEIQSLVGPTAYAQPKRMVNGLDYNRASQVAAILERRVGLSLAKQDIYASVVGGLSIEEPAADLALCLAIAGCARNRQLTGKTLVLGEVGLAGEVRPVNKLEARLREAERLGFDRTIVPIQDLETYPSSVRIEPIRRVSDALQVGFGR